MLSFNHKIQVSFCDKGKFCDTNLAQKTLKLHLKLKISNFRRNFLMTKILHQGLFKNWILINLIFFLIAFSDMFFKIKIDSGFGEIGTARFKI